MGRQQHTTHMTLVLHVSAGPHACLCCSARMNPMTPPRESSEQATPVSDAGSQAAISRNR